MHAFSTSAAARRFSCNNIPYSGNATVHMRKTLAKTTCRSLPSVRDFIRTECPLPGTDGFGYRERPAQATLTTSCIPIDKHSLVIPGQIKLYRVSEQQLQQIIQDQGQVVLCCFEDVSAGKLMSPKRGSYSSLGTVAGLQRLPGTQQALVRVVVTNRVAVQAVDCSIPNLIKAQSALLQDRWAYMVRTAALEQYNPSSSNSNQPEVTTALEQVQDAVAELQQLLQQILHTVRTVVDSPHQIKLQQALIENEAVEELTDVVGWCNTVGGPLAPEEHKSSGGTSSSNVASAMTISSGRQLLERAWRLSFATSAAGRLTKALVQCGGAISMQSKLRQEADERAAKLLTLTDLGFRLEESLELTQSLRDMLATQIALEQL